MTPKQEVELLARVAVLEERLRGVATSSTVLNSQTNGELGALRSTLSALQKDVAKGVEEEDFAELRDRVTRLEERHEGLKQDVTGQHRVTHASVPKKSNPPVDQKNPAIEMAKIIIPVVFALVAIVASVVTWLLTHQ
jgi:hypothetical protein